MIFEGEMISEIVPRKAERQPTGSPKKKKKHKLHRSKSGRREMQTYSTDIIEDDIIIE